MLAQILFSSILAYTSLHTYISLLYEFDMSMVQHVRYYLPSETLEVQPI